MSSFGMKTSNAVNFSTCSSVNKKRSETNSFFSFISIKYRTVSNSISLMQTPIAALCHRGIASASSSERLGSEYLIANSTFKLLGISKSFHTCSRVLRMSGSPSASLFFCCSRRFFRRAAARFLLFSNRLAFSSSVSWSPSSPSPTSSSSSEYSRSESSSDTAASSSLFVFAAASSAVLFASKAAFSFALLCFFWFRFPPMDFICLFTCFGSGAFTAFSPTRVNSLARTRLMEWLPDPRTTWIVELRCFERSMKSSSVTVSFNFPSLKATFRFIFFSRTCFCRSMRNFSKESNLTFFFFFTTTTSSWFISSVSSLPMSLPSPSSSAISLSQFDANLDSSGSSSSSSSLSSPSVWWAELSHMSSSSSNSCWPRSKTWRSLIRFFSSAFVASDTLLSTSFWSFAAGPWSTAFTNLSSTLALSTCPSFRPPSPCFCPEPTPLLLLAGLFFEDAPVAFAALVALVELFFKIPFRSVFFVLPLDALVLLSSPAFNFSMLSNFESNFEVFLFKTSPRDSRSISSKTIVSIWSSDSFFCSSFWKADSHRMALAAGWKNPASSNSFLRFSCFDRMLVVTSSIFWFIFVLKSMYVLWSNVFWNSLKSFLPICRAFSGFLSFTLRISAALFWSAVSSTGAISSSSSSPPCVVPLPPVPALDMAFGEEAFVVVLCELEESIFDRSENAPFFFPYTFAFGNLVSPNTAAFLTSSAAVLDMVVCFKRCNLRLRTNAVERCLPGRLFSSRRPSSSRSSSIDILGKQPGRPNR